MVAPSWPSSTTESLEWEPTNVDLVPRSRRHEVLSSYEATITPKIAEVASIPTPGALAAELTDAEAEIARFDAQTLSRLAPFVVVSLRTEAAASSQIENLSASASSIAVAEHATPTKSPIKPNAELIVANVTSLSLALEVSGPITPNEIVSIQQLLLANSAPDLTGKFRDEPVWVGGASYSPHRATYIAPHHSRVPAAIDDLTNFMARNDLPRLAHAAVAHAQFENIHPFPDGNGRTGRVIIQRMLRESGLTRHSLVPLSAGLLGSTNHYFDALTAYRQGDVEPILRAFINATYAALSNATTLVDELDEMHEAWRGQIRARSDSAIWPALKFCAGRLAITAEMLTTELGISKVNSYRQIEQLVDAGIVHQTSKARRNRVWLVTDVVAAVEDFMTRSQRRAAP